VTRNDVEQPATTLKTRHFPGPEGFSGPFCSCLVRVIKKMSDITRSAPVEPAAASATASLKFRPETAADADWINSLHEKCFGPGRFARTAFRVREMFRSDPDLNYCAVIDNIPVASVKMTPIGVGGVNGYLLGPLATDPDHRNKGAGRRLVAHVTALARARPGAEFVLLVGDAAYYEKLGFKIAPAPIVFPGPVDPHRVLVHFRPGSETGTGLALSGQLGPWQAAIR
jgi:predicted N-acetyltransferase YhbS